ncbi:uncharacterized protein [Triticum aestivum]|nr:uncharacterized protein LOC123098895 [Triticum aestivum]
MSRVESRSRDGFVALVCYTYSISEQQAVVLLCEHRFNLPSLQQGSKEILSNLASASLIAKHPQPAAFEDFLNSLTPSKLDCLHSLVISDRTSGNALSDDTLNRLKKMVSEETSDNAAATVQSTAPRLGQANLYRVSERRSTFKSEQAYVRARLENLLLDYGRDKGHTYKLGIICGVTTATYCYRHSFYATCFHINFLVSSDVSNDGTGSFCSWELFFAEFWNGADERIEQQSTNLPFCCPVKDSFDAYSIRCIVCDHTSCMIAHPSSGMYYTGNTRPGFPVHRKWGDDLRGMLELDFIYFDRRNSESAKTLLKDRSFLSSHRKPIARASVKLDDPVDAVSQTPNRQ